MRDKKIAIIHDLLVQRGGAENVLQCIAEIFPDAPIYTLLYDGEKMKGMFGEREIKTSFLQKFPKFLRKRYHLLLPFFPVASEVFDFRDFDLVISSSGAWSKGIVTKLNTKHVAYIHSPMRFVWDYNERYLKERGIKPSVFKRMLFSYLRIWDYLGSQRPEYLVANSMYTSDRIRKYYRRECSIIYPPASIEKPNEAGGLEEQNPVEKKYFLSVSRLSAYKKTDAIVEAFNKLGLPLIVIGEGQEEKRLNKIAESNVSVLGWQSEEQLARYYSGARALVFAAEEDFGIVPVEAMSFGIPVIAYKKGGVLETTEEGKTGEFFEAQTPEVISDGIRRFLEKEGSYDVEYIKNKAKRFSREIFKEKFGLLIENILNGKEG